MISIHTFELANEYTTKEFNRLLSCGYKNAKQNKNRLGKSTKYKQLDVRVDDSLAHQGITIEYHNGNFKKFIKLIVNPSEVLGGCDMKLWKANNTNTERLIEILKIHIDDYFNSEYKLNDFLLTRVEVTANLYVGKDNIPAYVNLMHKIGKVKKFSPKYSKSEYSTGRINKAHSFDLEGKSNNMGFTVYDKESDLSNKLNKAKTSDTKLKLKSKIKESKGILRIEVRLKKRKAIIAALQDITKETDISTVKEIKLVSRKCRDIFWSTFTTIIPNGDFYKLSDAEEIVNTSDLKKKQKEKMLRLLKLIPEKKSVYLALKELKVRDTDDVMDWFKELDLSPVTISTRGEVDYLRNLFDYLEA